jgi:membrane protein YdbS with pleckstrin-like domain
MIRTATTTNDSGETGHEREERERAQVEKYLLPNEEHVATVRRHPAVLIVPTAQAVIGLLVAFALTATLLRGRAEVLTLIVWGLWGLVMLRLVWEVWNWAVDYFVITSKRILLTSGVFTRSVAMMPLTKVTDMSFRRSFAGRMLGYGEFVVESAGQDQALRTIDHIPYPEELYQRVCERIFPDSGDAKKPTPAKQVGQDGKIELEPASAEIPEPGSDALLEPASAELPESDADDTHVLDAPEVDEP